MEVSRFLLNKKIRHKYDWQRYTKLRNHDQDYGKIQSISFSYDKKTLISISEDGSIVTHKVDFAGLNRSFQRIGDDVDNFKKGFPSNS